MHAVILALVSLAGGEPVVSSAYVAGDQACAACDGDCGCNDGLLGRRGDRRRGMPQTCYDPVYGCYTGSRYMHRYPAFHGTYYRRPYNYRNVFDYPWHAQPHEPTSQFSYNVEREELIDENQPPAPPRDARAPVGGGLRISVSDSALLAVPGESTRRTK